MNRLIYDISMLIGLALVTAGATMAYGAAFGLMICGGMVIGLTVLGTMIGKR